MVSQDGYQSTGCPTSRGPPLTELALPQTLHSRVAMSDVLPTEPALAQAGAVAGTGSAIPGTVWVPGQATLGTGPAISLTLVQLQPGHSQWRAHIQCLLGRNISRVLSQLGFTNMLSTRRLSQDPSVSGRLPEPLGFIHKNRDVDVFQILCTETASRRG